MTKLTKTTSQWEFDALIALAKSKELEICDLYLKEGYEVWPYFAFRNYKILGVGKPSYDDPIISFNEMIECIMGNHIRKIQLNDNYNAIIDEKSKTIEVGCQTFTFDKVKELYNLIK